MHKLFCSFNANFLVIHGKENVIFSQILYTADELISCNFYVWLTRAVELIYILCVLHAR